ncbi:MAG: hypothetical protein NVS2B6_06810 [Thermoleophilaceae bacterium]
MSFRSRLLLFFMIIVIVPMIAVALALFSITADSETGKADAAIAQGLRTAFAIYDDERSSARAPLQRIAADPGLGRALMAGNPAALTARLIALERANPAVKSASAYESGGRELATTGAADAVAPAIAAPTSHGRSIGLISVSTTTSRDFVSAARRVTGLEVEVAFGRRVIRSTAAPRTHDLGGASSGNVRIGGQEYRGRFARLGDRVGRDVSVGVFANRRQLSSRIGRRRTLIAAILGTFLLLALLSSIVVVRALQRQIDKFLEAARRLARGDFSRPVPVEGADEFAALGREFNAMSQQLASKIQEVQRKRGELEETIRRVGEAFAAGLDREEMVNLAVRTAVEACEAETGRALPIDARRMRSAHVGQETPALAAALEAAERGAFAIRADDLHDWIGDLDASSDTRDEKADQRRPVRARVAGVSAMAVPLMASLGRDTNVEQVGVVSIARSGRDFDDSEHDLFAYLIGQAAVSIENVDLHETVRVQAVTDELTGLSNMRHFHEALDAEIERSKRFGSGVGLLMLDIDNFKLVNDTYGHQQGDIVLMEVARVLRNLSRDIDLPARYGGEEMAVILPQTDVQGAELLAERMRSAIAALSIERLEGEGRIEITASFGVASLPACARDKSSLIHEADAALYRAKRAGKNRVSHGEPVTAEG